MPCVFRGHAFAFKNVAQVPATVITNDLCAAAIRIGYAAYGSGQVIVEAGPATTGIKLVVGVVERSLTTPTDKHAVGLPVVVFTGKGALGSFVFNNVSLLRAQYVPLVTCFSFHSLAVVC